MTKREVGIGLIGTGFAKTVQIPAFRKCENAKIVSISSGSIENARSAAEEFSIGHFSDDWRQTASHPEVDLVCITTPPVLHREMALFAIENGKHVLCEKPMAMNVQEADEMTRAAEAKALLALIDHELRFLPGRLRARQMIMNGEIGEIHHVSAAFQASYRGDPNAPWNWWSDETQGGGALGAIGSHIIDSCHWFLDTDIRSVFCRLRTFIKQRRDRSGEMRNVTADDAADLIVRFADGPMNRDATGTISLTMTDGPRYRNEMEFFGSKGAIHVDNLGEVKIARRGENDWSSVDVELGQPLTANDNGFSRGFLQLAPKLLDAVASGQPQLENAATFADGLRVQRVLDAARLSSKEGREETVG